jgi:hypothetical protein
MKKNCLTIPLLAFLVLTSCKKTVKSDLKEEQATVVAKYHKPDTSHYKYYMGTDEKDRPVMKKKWVKEPEVWTINLICQHGAWKLEGEKAKLHFWVKPEQTVWCYYRDVLYEEKDDKGNVNHSHTGKFKLEFMRAERIGQQLEK